jgi:hypothetical protein
LALFREKQNVGALLLLTLLISTTSVGIYATRYEGALSFVLPLVWLLIFAAGVNLFWNAMLKVGPDEIVIIRSHTDGRSYVVQNKVVLPPLTGWQEVVARVPTYNLSVFAAIKEVPTKSNIRIPQVKASVKFRIVNPIALHSNVSNRSQVYGDVAKELGLDLRRAPLEYRFWESVAKRQAESQLSSKIKALIWAEAEKPEDAFTKRLDLTKTLRNDLTEILNQIGLELVSASITEVETPEVVFNDAAARVRHDADANATRYAMMLDRMLDSIGERCTQFDRDELKALIMQAVREVQDQDRIMRVYDRDLHTP